MKKNKKDNHKKIGVYFLGLLIGINLIIAGALYKTYQKTVLSFNVSPVVITKSQYRPPAPQRVIIENRGIDLQTTPSEIIDDIWQVSNTDSSYLESSARPNEGGNVVIYGHNTNNIFGKLHNAQIDDIIKVENQDSNIIAYKVDSIQSVTPDTIDYVLPKDEEVLTLYTCTGFLDSKRLVVTAKPVE